jgi:hypothetical protein
MTTGDFVALPPFVCPKRWHVKDGHRSNLAIRIGSVDFVGGSVAFVSGKPPLSTATSRATGKVPEARAPHRRVATRLQSASAGLGALT